MPYDNTCKFLAENYPADFASWLLGAPVTVTLLDPTELSSEPIRADSLILLESDERILQMEFQTTPKPEVPFRMADYRLRIYRRSPDKRLLQFVIYLCPTQSPWVQQTQFVIDGLQNVMASVAILAGLVLGEPVIRQFIREDIVRESAMVQSWLSEGEWQAANRIATNMLSEGIDPQTIAKVTSLSLEQIQYLQAQLTDE